MEIIMSDQFSVGYRFSPEEVRSVVSPEYIRFLKEAGYVDLNKTPNLFVADRLLRVDDKVRETAIEQGLNFIDYRGYIMRIQQDSAKKLVHALGGKILTSAFMYKLLIPQLKQAVDQGNRVAQATLNEMVNDFAEHLEDRILDGNTLVVSNGKRNLVLPKSVGFFDMVDINEFGYPNEVKQNGEFKYWPANANENIAVRGRGSGLGLNLGRAPSVTGDGLGVRFAKFS